MGAETMNLSTHLRGSLAVIGMGAALAPAAWGLDFYSVKAGLPHPDITAIAVRGEVCWVGTPKGLAVRYGAEKSFIPYNGLKQKITALEMQGEDLWVGTESGLFRVSGRAPGEDRPVQVMTEKVWTLVRDSRQTLWLGTDTQLARLPPWEQAWQKVPLPNGVQGPVRAVAAAGSLCYVGAATPDLLILDQTTLRWLQRTPPGVKTTITAIAVYGSYIWAGMDGEGLLRFDWQRNTWEKMYSGELGESFVQACASNGSWSWFGTFNGVYQIDLENEAKKNGLEGLPEGSVNCLRVEQNRLWIGSEFGLGVYLLPVPQVECNPENSVVLKPQGAIPFSGTASSASGQPTVKAEFSVAGFPEVRFDRFLEYSQPDSQGGLRGSWKINDLPSLRDFYLLRLEAVDQLGRKNSALSQIIVAPSDPGIALDATAETLNVGLENITGAFDTPFASEIRVNPGNVLANLNREDMTFTATVNLQPGGNPISAQVTDWFGRQATATGTVQAKIQASENSIEVKASGQDVTLNLNEVLLFDSGKSELKEKAFEALEKVADYLNRDEKRQAMITGFTDNVPIHTEQFPDNLVLSKARAKSVFDYLVGQKQVKPERLSIQGLGDQQPIAENADEKGRAQNRRVEVTVKQAE